MDLPLDMQHQAMGYDRTATMFSPEGTILQRGFLANLAMAGERIAELTLLEIIIILCSVALVTIIVMKV